MQLHFGFYYMMLYGFLIRQGLLNFYCISFYNNSKIVLVICFFFFNFVLSYVEKNII